jgi:uncharacterized protein (DUF2236 family)
MFTDDSAIRRVHRESVVLLGGGRALLLQVAHPAVAAGVAAHSSYRHDRWGRLLRTLRPTLAIVFGTPEQAQRAAAAVNATHRHVVGPGYRATDPELLRWVLATLIDSALLMYTRFVMPLPEAEAASYYRDMCDAGALLGIPPDCMPPDLAAFRRYFDGMVATIEVSDAARGIAVDLARPAGALTPAIRALEQLTAGLLPPRIRAQFGLDWGPARQALLEVSARLSRALLPRIPPPLRAPPALVLPPNRGAAASDRRRR